ncbi:ComF family protein [Streptomyces aureocirculatus]|uniref:ComF family protein n=1 Tax=Streptomyces aureocirculatus TaxID=67275 RepID=UPI0004C4BB0A|nr:ComF family protein [Streptomyces aureocirculatus]
MRGWWRDLTDLVLPVDCPGCGTPRVALCAGCRSALCGASPRRVRPDPQPRGLPAVHAAAPYGGAVRAVLLAHKERGALPLAEVLGEALAGAVRAALRGAGQVGGGPVLLVPVPSARRAVRARGHDPVRRSALAAAGRLRRAGLPVSVLSVLRQRRAVEDQAGLNSRERQINLSGALEVAPGAGRLLRGAARIVVVDDLMTTGASLAEAARALRGVCGVHGVGDERRSTTAGVTGAQVAAERQRDNRPSCDRGDGRGRRTRKALPASEMPRSDTILAAVVAASPVSFEINRN